MPPIKCKALYLRYVLMYCCSVHLTHELFQVSNELSLKIIKSLSKFHSSESP